MDGEVIIGTRLDTKNLEKELKIAEKQLEQYEREAEKLTKTKIKTESDLQAYEEEKKLIEETTNESLKYAQTTAEVNNNLEIEKQQLIDLDEKYSEQLNKIDDINNKIKENARNQALVNNKIQQLNGELTRSRGFESIKEHIKDIGKHMDKNVKKIGRWALAIFGIRSAYMMVRQAMSTISKYDKQMATDLEYMRFAIANTLKPLIEGIVELAKKLMFYVGYIAKGWFGIDIYARSSAKDFKKANDEAKKLQKTLAGFDEMEVVSDASSQNGTDIPSFDLGNMQDMKVPSWLEWISNNGDKVAAILLGIAGGLLAIKTGAGLLMGLGIGIFIFEIAMLVEDIIKFLNDPTWENFYQILGDIAIIVGTIIFLLGGGGIVGAILILVGIIIKNWDKIKGIIEPIADWIYKNVIKPIGDFFKGLIDVLCAPFQALIDFIGELWNKIKKPIDDFVKAINKALSKIKDVTIEIGFKFAGGLFGKKSNNKLTGIMGEFKLPKLARGGIVNNPGAGVMMGNYIAGEKAPEAVLPLTDGTLQKLANMIPITVNVTNTMNGRVISKELQKVQNENNFAYNR